MQKDLDSKILEFLEKSLVADATKDMVRASLGHLGGDEKLQILKVLVNEQKKLYSLTKKKELLVQKYGSYMEKLSGKKA